MTSSLPSTSSLLEHPTVVDWTIAGVKCTKKRNRWCKPWIQVFFFIKYANLLLSRLYVIAHQQRKAPAIFVVFSGKKGLMSSFNLRKMFSLDIFFDQLVGFY